jgi:hypothetical protein
MGATKAQVVLLQRIARVGSARASFTKGAGYKCKQAEEACRNGEFHGHFRECSRKSRFSGLRFCLKNSAKFDRYVFAMLFVEGI